ncbi:MAG: hypothetical protein LN417_06380, partial [Candidatus Thermoplasmatota archaeon]|nr:hypothetical protein [Candidatus Thermoplasmatota archaeon]
MIFLVASVLAVAVPLDDPENGDEGLPALADDWRIEVVDSDGFVGTYTSMALDGRGHPHISYCDETNGALKYARWNVSAWSVETVDSAGFVGQYTSIALDANDSPHISYYDFNNTDLKYAKWTGSGWSIETVDSAGDVGGPTSMAL